MAMNRFNYSTPNQVRFQRVDPRLIEQAGTSAGSVGVGNILGEIEKHDKLAREQEVLKQAQANRDRLYNIQKTTADREQAEYDRKVAADTALSELLAKVPKTKEQLTKKTIKGTAATTNAERIAQAKADNVKRDAILQSVSDDTSGAVNTYNKLMDEYESTQNKGVTEVRRQEVSRPASSTKDVKFTTPSGRRLNPYEVFKMNLGLGEFKPVDEFTSDSTARANALEKFRPISSSVDNRSTIPSTGLGEFKLTDEYPQGRTIYNTTNVLAPAIEQQRLDNIARVNALEKSGLNRLNQLGIDVGKAETVPELKTANAVADRIETISTSVDTTDADKSKALRKLLITSDLPGSVKIEALKNIKNIYPEPEKLTVSEQLALRKDRRELVKDSETFNDYKTIYAGVIPDGITTLAGAKAFSTKYENMLKRSGKDKGKFNLGEKMFTELTIKDTDDIEVVDDWLKKYDSRLAKMSTNEKKTLFAEMQSRYAQEAEYIDLSDWFGGSAFNDIIDKFQLK
jgi:hypothetical protein